MDDKNNEIIDFSNQPLGLMAQEGAKIEDNLNKEMQANEEARKNSNVQDNCVVHCSKDFPVVIKDNVSVGHGAVIHGCTLEDNVLAGGFGSAVAEFVADENLDSNLLRFGIPDEFIEHGTQKELFDQIGLTAPKIANKILKHFKLK